MTYSPIQKFAYVFGAAYLVVGIMGFLLTGLSGFLSSEGRMILFFEVNPLHNLVHLIIGIVWLGAAPLELPSRAVTQVLSVVLILVGAVGFFITSSEINVMAINHPDNLLHLATGLLGAWLSFTPAGLRT